MGKTFWRRMAAALAVIVGVGVGASSVPASAHTPHAQRAVMHANVDWWW